LELAAPLAKRLGEAALEGLARELLGALPGGAAAELRWDAAGIPGVWLEPGAGSALYDLSPALPLVLPPAPALVAASLPRAPAGRGGPDAPRRSRGRRADLPARAGGRGRGRRARARRARGARPRRRHCARAAARRAARAAARGAGARPWAPRCQRRSEGATG